MSKTLYTASYCHQQAAETDDIARATGDQPDIFTGAKLMELLDYAERTERKLRAKGKAHETEVIGQVISILRRRLAH